MRTLNLEQLTEAAETIFVGRCLEVRREPSAFLDHAVARVTFRVDRVLRGDLAETFTLKILDEKTLDMPRFAEGEDVVLFLYGESALGLSSPVGLGQGRFTLTEDKHGRKLAINAYGNKNLFSALSGRARSKLGTSFDAWKDESAIEQQSLLEMVQLLQP